MVCNKLVLGSFFVIFFGVSFGQAITPDFLDVFQKRDKRNFSGPFVQAKSANPAQEDVKKCQDMLKRYKGEQKVIALLKNPELEDEKRSAIANRCVLFFQNEEILAINKADLALILLGKLIFKDHHPTAAAEGLTLLGCHDIDINKKAKIICRILKSPEAAAHHKSAAVEGLCLLANFDMPDNLKGKNILSIGSNPEAYCMHVYYSARIILYILNSPDATDCHSEAVGVALRSFVSNEILNSSKKTAKTMSRIVTRMFENKTLQDDKLLEAAKAGVCLVNGNKASDRYRANIITRIMFIKKLKNFIPDITLVAEQLLERECIRDDIKKFIDKKLKQQNRSLSGQMALIEYF